MRNTFLTLPVAVRTLMCQIWFLLDDIWYPGDLPAGCWYRMTHCVDVELGLGRTGFAPPLRGDLGWIVFFLWASVSSSLR